MTAGREGMEARAGDWLGPLHLHPRRSWKKKEGRMGQESNPTPGDTLFLQASQTALPTGSQEFKREFVGTFFFQRTACRHS